MDWFLLFWHNIVWNYNDIIVWVNLWHPKNLYLFISLGKLMSIIAKWMASVGKRFSAIKKIIYRQSDNWLFLFSRGVVYCCFSCLTRVDRATHLHFRLGQEMVQLRPWSLKVDYANIYFIYFGSVLCNQTFNYSVVPKQEAGDFWVACKIYLIIIIIRIY